MKKLHIGQVEVPYEITWSPDRETFGLSLDSDGTLEVKAPVDSDLDEVQDILENKKPWILKKIHKLNDQSLPPADKEFLSGEKFLFNGRRYPLKHRQENGKKETLQFTDQTFQLYLSESDDERHREKASRLLKEWYQETAREELIPKVRKFASKLDAEIDDIEIHDSIREWGKHDNGTIKLHWKLILAPTGIQDYVIVHELAHFDTHAHGQNFWNKVGSVLPDYEERREWLRKNGNKLQI